MIEVKHEFRRMSAAHVREIRKDLLLPECGCSTAVEPKASVRIAIRRDLTRVSPETTGRADTPTTL
jgi:hypothetical protein